MRRTVRTGVFVVTMIAVGLAWGAKPSEFRSLSAKLAHDKFQKETDDANKQYVTKYNQARSKYLAAMKSAMVSTTKAGDLEEANKLKAIIDHLEKTIPQPKRADAEQQPAPDSNKGRPNGRWKVMNYAAGAQEIISFDQDDSVVKEYGGGKKMNGKLVQRGDDWYIDFEDRDTDRVSLAGNRLFIEHWRQDQNGFPHTVMVGVPTDK